MRADHVTLNSGQACGYQKLNHAGQPDPVGKKAAKASQSGDDASEASTTEEPTTEEQASVLEGGDNAKGVIRLLQEGHFKGVADVRLRINFFDKIASIEHANLRVVTDDSVNALVQAVETGCGPMIESGQLTQEQADALLATFQQTTAQLVEEFLGGQITSSGALIEELRACFDNLVAGLPAAEATTEEPAIEPAGDEGSTGEVAEDLTEGSGQTDLQASIDGLTDAFLAVLQTFADALNDVRVLPALSPPEGNGVAYQKFLEIYNELRGVVASETPADGGSVDTVT